MAYVLEIERDELGLWNVTVSGTDVRTWGHTIAEAQRNAERQLRRLIGANPTCTVTVTMPGVVATRAPGDLKQVRELSLRLMRQFQVDARKCAVELVSQGVKQVDVATLLGLTRQRVNQLLED